MRNLIRIQQPSYESPGGISGAGSGGGGSALPGSIADTSGSGSGGSGGSGTPATPQHVDINPDSYIKVPGQDKPVKYSDYIGGFVPKADFTRKQQEAAARIQALERASQEQESRFRDAAQKIWGQVQGGQRQPDPNSLPAVLAQLENAPYVDGRTAAGLVRNLVNTSVMPLAQAIKQRDQALALMFQRIQALDGTVGSLRNRTSAGDFQSKLASARTSMSLPDDPAINEMLQDIYLSHEGPELDQEFPTLAKQRFDQLRALVRTLDKKEADDAKKQRIGIPGRGGSAATGRPLRKGFQSAQQIADDLWPGIVGSET